jgi:hypothetical protein
MGTLFTRLEILEIIGKTHKYYQTRIKNLENQVAYLEERVFTLEFIMFEQQKINLQELPELAVPVSPRSPRSRSHSPLAHIFSPPFSPRKEKKLDVVIEIDPISPAKMPPLPQSQPPPQPLNFEHLDPHLSLRQRKKFTKMFH